MAILAMEYDKDIAGLVALHLRDAGHEVSVVHDGEEGLNEALSEKFELLVLDIMLPNLNGLELCRFVRAKQPDVLILMLTAKSAEVDRVLGLEIGTDDYLTKPFSIRELIARVKALLRRKEKIAASATLVSRLELGELVIDFDKHEVKRSGEVIELTAKEFDLLAQLAKNPGKVYSRVHLKALNTRSIHTSTVFAPKLRVTPPNLFIFKRCGV